MEDFAIFEALRKTTINETYINILQNIFSLTTAKIHLGKLVSDELHINRGVRQGDPLSPEGINDDGENLTNLRFADDVAHFRRKKPQNKWKTLNQSELSLKVCLKIHKGKTKYTKNHADREDQKKKN